MYWIYHKNKLLSKVIITNDDVLLDYALKSSERLELRSFRLAYNIINFIVMTSKFKFNDFDIRKVGE